MTCRHGLGGYRMGRLGANLALSPTGRGHDGDRECLRFCPDGWPGSIDSHSPQRILLRSPDQNRIIFGVSSNDLFGLKDPVGSL